MMEGLNYMDLIRQGWLATYPLIFGSALMVGVIMERLFALRGGASSMGNLAERILPTMAKGDFPSAASICKENLKNPLAKIFHSSIQKQQGKTIDEISVGVEERRFEELQNLKRNIWILGTIGSSAPFIGLFGTVIGIIKSFNSMAQAGTGGFSVVAAGISEALVATALGLLVAIIALIAYNCLQVRVGDINTAIKINSAKLMEAFREGRRANGSGKV
ncbi:MAG: MotA/TolQ/ExbB proton channel family protein [Deltaproteobacteria bacterium]